MFQNVPECMQKVPECSRMHAECSKMLQNAYRMFQNVPECMQYVPECSRMHAECSRMLQNACRSMSLHAVTWASRQLHKLTCSYISLHAVTWACMQFPVTWSSMSLHAVSWACMQFLSLSEQLTKISQCLFTQNPLCRTLEQNADYCLWINDLTKPPLVSVWLTSHSYLVWYGPMGPRRHCVFHIEIRDWIETKKHLGQPI